MFLPRRADSRPFVVVLAALVLCSWLALAAWGLSPYSRYLGHENLDRFSIHHDAILTIIGFVGGWTLMVVAMMLPTTLPLLVLFRNLVRARTDRVTLLLLVVAGYLAIWGLFGVVAHVGDAVIHFGVDHVPWLSANAWIIGAATLLVAGVYQLTPLKYHCLDKCRSPFSFVMEHWRGERERWFSFRLGVSHGIFCVGCCWSLMLLMFAVGAGNLAWMLLLAAVMAIEKNLPWGRRLSLPLGVTLIALGCATVVRSIAGV